MLNIFLKIKNGIKYRIEHDRPGLYLFFLFPIALSFLITYGGARILNTIFPDLSIPFSTSIYVHHFVYGFFIMAISGYLALIHDGPRARYLIALLHGFGLGLAMDEYGIWLQLAETEVIRWSYDGLVIFVAFVVLIISAKPGVKLVKLLWPFD